jgi:hypothetical protein
MAEKTVTRNQRGRKRIELIHQYPHEYEIWIHLRQRCNNPNNESYPHYGGRGIRVDPAWDTFKGFMDAMGPRPDPSLSVERRNNDKNYGEPGNCYWGTSDEQNNNNRHNHRITYEGKTLTLEQWCRETGLNHTTVLKRIRLGWTDEQALGLAPPPFNPKAHTGMTVTKKLDCGVNRTTYSMRIASGWSEEAARQNIDGRKSKQKKHPNYIYVSHPSLGEGEFTIQQAAQIVGRKPNSVTVAISRGRTPLQALGLEE